MADATHGAPRDLVLLDEWHVRLLAPQALDGAEAERLRSEIVTALRALVRKTTRSFEVVLRVGR